MRRLSINFHLQLRPLSIQCLQLGILLSHRIRSSSCPAHTVDRGLDLVTAIHALIVLIDLISENIEARAGNAPAAALSRIHRLFTDLDAAVRKSKFHLVKIGMVDADDRVEFVRVFITRRIVADRMSVAVGSSDLGSMLLHIEVTANRLREIQNIRVRRVDIFCRGNHELSGIIVDQELRARVAESSCGIKSSHGRLILFTIFKLFIDVCLCAVTALGKPR